MTARRPKPRRTRAKPTTERGPGRPALGDAKRSETVRIRVTPALKSRVDATAEAAGMTTSDWGLGLLVSALHPTPTDPPT